jgi:hypothetical protein
LWGHKNKQQQITKIMESGYSAEEYQLANGRLTGPLIRLYKCIFLYNTTDPVVFSV